MLQGADGGDYDFVAAAERERHAVAFEAVARVGGQDYIGRGIVGVGVNGVGAGERSRSWGSDVADGESGNCARHDRFLCAAW